MADATQFVPRAYYSAGLVRDSPTFLGFSGSSLNEYGFEASVRLVCKKKENKWGNMRILTAYYKIWLAAMVEKNEKIELKRELDDNAKKLSIVMKFGVSSAASVERMMEVPNLILIFPEERTIKELGIVNSVFPGLFEQNWC